MAEEHREICMDRYQNPAADPAGDQLERAALEPQQQAALWLQITSATTNEQELLLAHASLIDALPARAIYARHPDQFANVTAIYRMKCDLFKRLQQTEAIEQLCSEDTLKENR